ncbi:MAG: AAA family ATPase [Lacrimispora saccharolytica]
MAAMLPHQGAADKITHQELVTLLSEDHARIAQVTINQNPQVPTGEVIINMADGTEKQMYVTDVNEVEQLLRQSGIDGYNVTDVPQENILLTVALPILLSTVVVVIIIMVMNRSAGGGGANARMMNFGKSRARMSRDNKVNFSNVAGLEEEKEELEEVVDFLRNPRSTPALAPESPRACCSWTVRNGKTPLPRWPGRRACPSSPFPVDFVEMFVGVGASRVRDLFDEAKRNSPCIVFIDEIDAVARRRGTGMGGGHDEREQTLNQLLVEMDGFGVNEGIIVMAATNRVDILDPAILRPGRFDRRVVVGPPDVMGREEILKVHAKNKPLAEDVDLKQIAQTTAGFTGAELENLLNEAAIMAAKDRRRFVRQSDIKSAFIKVGIGAEKRSKVISDKENGSPHTMRQAMHPVPYAAGYGGGLRSPLSRQVLAQRATRCRSRRTMICSRREAK